MDANVKLQGFDELARALEQAKELFMPLASKAIALSLKAIEEEIAPYPPQPDRMRSGHLNTYVRGIGFYPKSAFVADTNEPGGFSIKRVKSTQIRYTSEQMDKRFKSKVKVTDKAITGELRNTASYSGYVIGWKMGDPHQKEHHSQTGWVSADDAIEKARPKIEQSINTAIDEFLRKL